MIMTILTNDWIADFKAMIKDCEQPGSRLFAFERDFIRILREEIEFGIYPTNRQRDRLLDMWSRVPKGNAGKP